MDAQERACDLIDMDSRQGRTPVDEALGRPFQDRILTIINSFGTTTEQLDKVNFEVIHILAKEKPKDIGCRVRLQNLQRKPAQH